MSKKVAVLFSGGLDSTYLVWKNLSEGNEVQPIYIEVGNNKVKSIIEKNRVQLLVKEFRKEFNKEEEYSTRIQDVRFILKVDVDAREDSLLFKQVPLWILAIIFSQDLNVDEIQIAYVLNDCAISYLEDIQNVYKSYKPLMRYLKPLVFPLTKMPKYEIAHELPKQYRKFIFSCENAMIIGSEDAEFIEYEPCCMCTPCKHIMADNYYGMGYPDIYKKNVVRSHAYDLRDMGYKVFDKDGKEFEPYATSSAESIHLMPEQLKIKFPPDLNIFKSPGIHTIEYIATLEKKINDFKTSEVENHEPIEFVSTEFNG